MDECWNEDSLQAAEGCGMQVGIIEKRREMTLRFSGRTSVF
jgi:hypothetical protein